MSIHSEKQENPNDFFTQKPCQCDAGKWISEVRSAVESLDYGEVVISVHQNKVVQVQKTTKVRF